MELKDKSLSDLTDKYEKLNEKYEEVRERALLQEKKVVFDFILHLTLTKMI